MSKHDKKDASASTFTSTTSNNIKYTDNNYEGSSSNNISNQSSFYKSAEENKQSLNQSLDETKRNIQKNLAEVSSQIPHYAQTIRETQENAIQATREIADNYIEYQKQAINSLQSIFTPYFENTNNQFWNNHDYFNKQLPELYSKILNNYAENATSANRMFNDFVSTNVESFKNISNSVKEHSKQLCEIGKRNAKLCEGIHRNNLDNTNSYISNSSFN